MTLHMTSGKHIHTVGCGQLCVSSCSVRSVISSHNFDRCAAEKSRKPVQSELTAEARVPVYVSEGVCSGGEAAVIPQRIPPDSSLIHLTSLSSFSSIQLPVCFHPAGLRPHRPLSSPFG
ncbi:hypothetical protein MHYP_G00074460 [Metynnis hypsauchen]